MAISLGSNLALHTRLPLDDRTIMETIEEMKDYPENFLPDIAYCFVKSDGKMYVFNRENESTELTGKWRVLEGSGGGTAVTVDTAMSSTSTNPVQNKVIKAYVDGKSVDISADSDNAIQTKTDGIYVEKTKISTDDGNALSKKSDGLFVEDLSNKVNALNIAQKTINEDLDYCFVGFWNNTNSEVHATCTRGAAIPFNTKFEGNLDFNSTNKAIKLKAGHRYKLHYQCKQTGTTVNANHMERFYNETTSEWLKMACNCDTEDETHTMEEIYVPTVDCEVSVRNCWCPVASFSMRVNCVNTNPDGPGLKTIDCESAFIVTEIGKTVIIDPVEYVDSTKGIEDTPVGHIIPYIGNTAPKHYLVCDGTEYNITDYPYLAQHFKDEFGKVNYFGGDGTTTFAVLDLRGEFLRGTGTNSHANQGSGATVGEHQDGTDIPVIAQYIANDTAYLYTPGRKTERYPHEMDSVLIEGYTGFNTVRSERAEQGNNTTDIRRESITTRPTNTSVLYCIKYEPTYFMKNTYSADSVYSTDEMIIGRWIDGKPIYRKVVQGNITSKNQSLFVVNENVETMISIRGYDFSNGIYYFPFNYAQDGSTQKAVFYKKDTDTIEFRSNSSESGEVFVVILEYTKTAS